MAWAISRHYQRDEFPEQLTLDDKIMIFTDRVRGWQLYPAEEIIDIIPHSGFVVLYSLMHYFEMIAKFMEGFTKEGQSKQYFKKGFKHAATYLVSNTSVLTDLVMESFYSKVRSALYHTGLVGPGIILTSNVDSAIQLQDTNIILNPYRLARALQQHFDAYVRKLNDPNETALRQNFETRFDYLHG